jgi:acyl carrier protein
MTIAEICALVEDYCKVSHFEKKTITPETQFSDLGFDITVVNDLLVFIRDKTDILIPEGEYFTPNDIYRFIQEQ